MRARDGLVLGALACLVGMAALAPPARANELPSPATSTPAEGGPPGAEVRVPPPLGAVYAANDVSKIIFLNRCVGGCTVRPGPNDARDDTSTILTKASYITEFAHGDEVWEAVVACVRELYAPYDVEITDVDPGPNVFHHEAIVAGTYQDIDYEYPIGGVAPSQCFPNNNVISFTFANGFGPNPLVICEVIGQESAHSFGLEHAYDCSDPMTYLPRCGRQFFRDRTTPCGEYTALAQCQCGGSAQNSHRWLKTVLGANPTPVPGPTVTIVQPEAGAPVANRFTIAAGAAHMRGVEVVELWLNGTRYERRTMTGKTEVVESFQAPADLADGIIDVEIRAQNDIGSETVAVVTVTKGEPCTGAEQCLDGQVCDDGRCRFPPASGELGDGCQHDAECVSGICARQGETGHCSQECFPIANEATCPTGFACHEVGVNRGVCWPGAAEEDSWCGCTGGSRPTGGAAVLVLLVALLLRRPLPSRSASRR